MNFHSSCNYVTLLGYITAKLLFVIDALSVALLKNAIGTTEDFF